MRFYGWMHKILIEQECNFILPLVVWTFIMQSVAFIASITRSYKAYFLRTITSHIFREQFLLHAPITTYLNAPMTIFIACTDDNLLHKL